MATLTNAYACLIFDATTDSPIRPSADGWQKGPLPVALPDLPGVETSRVADEAARKHYFAERVQPSLYGLPSDDESANTRWHKFALLGDGDRCGNVVEAWELLRKSSNEWLAVAHIRLGSNPFDSLAFLIHMDDDYGSFARAKLPTPLVLLRTRPRSLTHLLWHGASIPDPALSSESVAAPPSWSAVQKWLWLLASGTSFTLFSPDPQSPDMNDGLVYLSTDWRALVLRDGVAFVALTSWKTSVPSFHDRARSYVRSIHLDAFLLGILQLDALSRQADFTSRLGLGTMDPTAISKLEADLLRVRAQVWWEDIGRRGTQTSQVLRAFQRQHRLGPLYRKIVEDLTDAARYIQAQQAATADATRISETARRQSRDEALKLEELRKQEFEQTLTWITFVLLPASLTFGGVALWANPSPHLG